MDAATQRQLTRGERLVQVLKQPQYKPLNHEKQVTILYAATRGYLDQFPSDTVAKYEAGLYPFVEERYPQIFTKLEEAQDITSEIEDLLKKALEPMAKSSKTPLNKGLEQLLISRPNVIRTTTLCHH